jgi:DNA-binding NarL/FixJ family response regulator
MRPRRRGTRVARDVSLTRRQAEVLTRAAHGRTDQQIAFDLDVSVSAVRAHVRAASRRLDTRSRTEVVAKALSLGLITYKA